MPRVAPGDEGSLGGTWQGDQRFAVGGVEIVENCPLSISGKPPLDLTHKTKDA